MKYEIQPLTDDQLSELKNKIWPNMTAEQQADVNAKAQHESWLKAEKLNCRKRAMEYAVQIKIKDGCDIYSEAQKMYDWLIKDLE